VSAISSDQCTIQQLNLYPVKGCRGYAVEKATVTTEGLVGDRMFSVIQNGQRTGQKKIANLRMMSAEWQDDDLMLSFPGSDTFRLTNADATNSVAEPFRGKEVPLLDMGDSVAQWLAEYLGPGLRLAKVAQPVNWILPLPEFSTVHDKPQSKFVDAAPLLMTSQNSLVELNSRLDQPVGMDRFRANVVVSGLDAFQEDNLAQLRFSGATLNRVTVCERCVVINTDPETGDISKEPLKTLSRYRKRSQDYAGGIQFGVYCTVSETGELRVGEPCLNQSKV
jgi:uncharacterized protein